MTVSVVIPCYLQGHLVAGAIRSALAQTAGGTEVVLVDDGSPDDTAAVAQTFAGRIRYLRQDNAGLAAARNAGFRASAGEFVLFLDADDEIEPELVARHLDALAASPGAGVTSAGWVDIDAAGREGASHEAVDHGADPYHFLLQRNRVPPCAWFARRSVLERAGGFRADAALHGHEDWDLWLRVAADGVPFATTRGARARYRVQAGSMSGNVLRMSLGALGTVRAQRGVHRDCAICRRQIPETIRWLRWHMARELGPMDLLRAAVREPLLLPTLPLNACCVAWRFLRDAPGT